MKYLKTGKNNAEANESDIYSSKSQVKKQNKKIKKK